MAEAIFVRVNSVSFRHVVDSIRPPGKRDEVRIEEVDVVPEDGRCVALWINGDEDNLKLLLVRGREGSVDVCDVRKSGGTDVWAMGEPKAKQHQATAKARRRKRPAILVGGSKIWRRLSRAQLRCVEGRPIFSPARNRKKSDDKRKGGKASGQTSLSSSHVPTLLT